jgi:hypothetical protein
MTPSYIDLGASPHRQRKDRTDIMFQPTSEQFSPYIQVLTMICGDMAAQAVVRQVRSLAVPAGFTPLVGGDIAQDMDLFAALGASIP